MSLSDERIEGFVIGSYPHEEVKAAIKELKEKNLKEWNTDLYNKMIDEVFGEELSNG